MTERPAPVAPRARRGWSPWLAGALLGLAVGVAVGVSASLAVGAALALAALYAFARSDVRAEIVAGLYWIVLDVYFSVFAGADVAGLFYPFYAALFLGLALRLARRGLRADRPALTLYLAFLFVVAASFLDFEGAIDLGVVQRVLAYLFGGLMLFQVGSRRGLGVLVAAALTGSATASGWVVVTAARAGFGYRGDVAMDPNVVAFLVGIGAVMTACLALGRVRRRGALPGSLGLVLLLALHVYAMLLLASRGVTIALLIGTVALLARAARDDRRNLAFVGVMAAVVGGAFLLPGGAGLVTRFESEQVQTGGGRFPIWETTLASYSGGGPRDLLLGHGFDSSETLVQRRFATLTSTHEAYLQMLYEFGFVGLALFLALHLALLVRGWTLRNRYGLMMVGVVCFLLGADLSLNVPDSYLYWTALGLVMALGAWGGPVGAPERA